MYEAKWMALLSYQTLLRVRRAAALYDGRPPHARRATFWHGVAAPAERPAAAPIGGAAATIEASGRQARLPAAPSDYSSQRD